MKGPNVRKQLGFIGAGAMAEAMMRGFLAADVAEPESIVAYDVAAHRLSELQEGLGIGASASVADVMSRADIVFIAVKPQHIEEAIAPCVDHLRSGTIVVSLAAGVTLGRLHSMLGDEAIIVRVMPNTAALVGQGTAAVCGGHRATPDQVALIRSMMESVGMAVTVDESLFDAVTGLSGSGPAYVCLVIEALADGGVAAGLPRHVALQLAAATVQGTGALVDQALEQGSHPAVLREQVTSPGGTTAAGLAVLEREAVRYALAKAVQQASQRSQELSKE